MSANPFYSTDLPLHRRRARRPALLAIASAALLPVSGACWRADAEPGTVDYRAIEATLAPGVEIEALPWSSRLPADGADDFDVSPDGPPVVLIGGRLFDPASGDPLVERADSLASLGFAAGALAVATADGRMGYLEDGGIHLVAPPLLGPARLQSAAENGELLLVRTEEPYGLASLQPGRPVEPIGSVPTPIVAADAGAGRRVFATDTELWSIEPTGDVLPILKLPPASPPLLGVAVRGGTVYFSTASGVYAVVGELALPVALDVGGPLRGTAEGLVVLNRANGRLYRLSGPGLRPDVSSAARPEPDGTRTLGFPPGAIPFHCGPEHPSFVRDHPLDDRSYPECFDLDGEVRAAAFLQRPDGIPYLVLHAAWTLEEDAAPLEVDPSQLRLAYLSPDGVESRLEPVRDLTGASATALVFGMRHELTATTLQPGEGHSGTLFFYPPEEPAAEGATYTAAIHVRRSVLLFEIPAEELTVAEDEP